MLPEAIEADRPQSTEEPSLGPLEQEEEQKEEEEAGYTVWSQYPECHSPAPPRNIPIWYF